jgi:hypothetical protein
VRRLRQRAQPEQRNGGNTNHGSTVQSAFGSSPNISGAYIASTRVAGR